MNKGAQPTDTVKNLLSKQGIMAKFADAKLRSDWEAQHETTC